MAEATINTESGQLNKHLSYDDKVIKKIAGIATDDIGGVLTLSGGLIGSIADRFRSSEDKTKGIDAEVGEKQVALDLNVVCEYGNNVPKLFGKVIDNVSQAVTSMTGLQVVEVNMHVEDVLNHNDFEKLRADQKNEDYDKSSSRGTPVQ